MKILTFIFLFVFSTITFSQEPITPVISLAPTDVVAFVDSYTAGPINKPILISSISEFEKNFGKFNTALGSDNRAYLQIRQFFLNGGKRALINRVTAHQELGSVDLKTGIYALADFNILVLPGIASFDESEAQTIRSAALALATSKNAFLIIDPPAGITPDALIEWRDNSSELIEQSIAAAYYPRIKIEDLSSTSKERFIELSGSIAAALSAKPAWSNPSNFMVVGAKGLEYKVDDRTLQNISIPTNGVAINPIKPAPNNGALVSGARTFDGNSLDNRNIKTVRTSLLIKSSLQTGLKSFSSYSSNNDSLLKIRTAITNLLTDLWKKGGLTGSTATCAFNVDVSFDPAQTRILNVVVNVALSHEGEFTELTFKQQMK